MQSKKVPRLVAPFLFFKKLGNLGIEGLKDKINQLK